MIIQMNVFVWLKLDGATKRYSMSNNKDHLIMEEDYDNISE